MDDFDITAFAKMFDAALASDNPAVRKALRNFMMIAAIAESENDSDSAGPFGSLLTRMDAMEYELRDLKRTPYAPYPGSTSTGYPGSLFPPAYPGTYTSTIGSSGIANFPTSTSGKDSSNSMSPQAIEELIKDLTTDSYWSDNDVGSLEKAFKDFNAK
jgi:hypothetical protein